MRYLAAFLLGVMAGMALVVPVAARRVELLEVERRVLQRDLEETRQKLRDLEEARSRWQASPVVRAVSVRVANVADRSLRLRLEERLRPLVADLVGREVRRLDPVLMGAVFAERTVRVGDKEFAPVLRQAFVGEELMFVVEVREVANRRQPVADLRHPQGWE